MNKSKDNCTAMIVGKKATIDGSTIIARDEDCLLYTSPSPRDP